MIIKNKFKKKVLLLATTVITGMMTDATDVIMIGTLETDGPLSDTHDVLLGGATDDDATSPILSTPASEPAEESAMAIIEDYDEATQEEIAQQICTGLTLDTTVGIEIALSNESYSCKIAQKLLMMEDNHKMITIVANIMRANTAILHKSGQLFLWLNYVDEQESETRMTYGESDTEEEIATGVKVWKRMEELDRHAAINLVKNSISYFRTMIKQQSAVALNQENLGNYITALIGSNQTTLQLSGLGINAVPSTINQLTALKNIDLSHNQLVTLQMDTFHYLSELESLNLSHNLLTELPETLFQDIGGLITIDISHNHIAQLLPGIFSTFTQLIKLDLSHNRLEQLPAGIFNNLGKLLKLDINNNALNALDAMIFHNTRKILFLNLANNRITTLADNIFNRLEILKNLDLSHNRLNQITLWLSANLRTLEKLNLSHNALEVLSKDVFKHMCVLGNLDLSHNQIASLPVNIFKEIINLEYLDLSHNQLVSLPANIFRTVLDLRYLILSHNRIIELPTILFRPIYELELLDLSFNEFIVFPIMQVEIKEIRLVESLDATKLDAQRIELPLNMSIRAFFKKKEIPVSVKAKVADQLIKNYYEDKILIEIIAQLLITYVNPFQKKHTGRP